MDPTKWWPRASSVPQEDPYQSSASTQNLKPQKWGLNMISLVISGSGTTPQFSSNRCEKWGDLLCLMRKLHQTLRGVSPLSRGLSQRNFGVPIKINKLHNGNPQLELDVN